jgi:tripartite-type tricarboxylate transporter receptor subunit TctC
MLDAILGRTGDEIDPTRYAWIGSIASDSDVCSFWKTSGIRTFEDMLTRETVIGSVGKGDQATTFPTVINNVLHTKMKIIMGYKGTGDRLLALERGELTGSCGINASTLMSIGQKQIEDGDLIPVVQSGLVRQRAFPNVPLTQSFARTDEQRLILETIFSQMAIARAYAAPPGVPPEQVALLRTAFSQAVRDPDFLAEAVKSKVEISPMSGEDVQQLIAKLAGISGDLKSKVTAALGD